ncbi:MAG: glycosyltransferase family 39 protein [Bryobacteraceae bacterium]
MKSTVPPLRQKGWRFHMLLFAAACLLLAATRLPVAPKHLFYFDSINFALALDEFNPALHQPQPPGYPLFVGLTRIIRLFLEPVEAVMLAAGILGGAAAAVLVWKLAARMFGNSAAWLAALLFLFNPVFWVGGVTNQVRVFLAVVSTAVALLAWRAWSEPSSNSRPWFCAAAFTLGLLSGFRPASLLLLAPLLIAAGLRGRRTHSEFALAGLLVLAGVLPWMLVTVLSTGGVRAYAELVTGYLHVQSRDSSLVFGAETHSARRMFLMAVIWNGLGALAWIWALPLVWRSLQWKLQHSQALFLGIWFLPPFLFHALIHVGDPDQVLITIPIVCLAGAYVLSRLPGWRLALAALLAVALSTFLFFRPFRGIASAASYTYVRDTARQIEAVFSRIEAARPGRPILITSADLFVTWRHVSYYFPDLPLYVLHDSGEVWLLLNRKTQSVPRAGADILAPHGRRLLWLLSPRYDRPGLPSFGHSGDAITIGPHRLRFAAE